MKKETKNSIRNLLAAVLIFVLIIAGAEIFLSLRNRESENYSSVSAENNSIVVLQAEHLSFDKLLMSETNAYNMRYYELEGLEKKDGYPLINYLTDETEKEDAVNVVVIGDSFVYGAYSLNRNELFWRLLENDFRQEGKKVNVYGVGATGANAYEELDWLTKTTLIEDLQPDMVIFCYVYNDADDSVDIEGSEVDWEKEIPLFKVLKKLLPNISELLIERISAETMYTDKYKNGEYVGLDGAPPVLKGRFLEKYKNDFAKKLDAFAATVDFPVAVVTLPTVPGSVMLEALYEPLEDLYKETESVHYYNLTDAYNRFASFKHRENYSVNIADFHPGSAANRFYADSIKEIAERDFPEIFENLTDTYVASDEILINEYLPCALQPEKLFEDEKSCVYKIEYPSSSETYKVHGIETESCFLKNPLGKEYVKLSFSDSVYLEEIKAEGDYGNIDIYYTCENEKLNYDDHSIFEPERTEKDTFIPLSGRKITSIIVSADFVENENREITLSFKKGGSAE